MYYDTNVTYNVAKIKISKNHLAEVRRLKFMLYYVEIN